SEEVWSELRSLSPMHAGMTYPRLEELGGIQWPCVDEQDAGSPFLHGRLWAEPIEGPPAPFHAVDQVPPVDELTEDYPIRLTTGTPFMTLHFPDQVATNIRTIDATDPKSGTAEFKASAIRIEKLRVPEAIEAAERDTVPAA